MQRLEVRPFSEQQIALAGDVRRPGRHRDRERPAVRGAGAAERRASGEPPAGQRSPGAADGDRRSAAGHRLLADRPHDGAGGDRGGGDAPHRIRWRGVLQLVGDRPDGRGRVRRLRGRRQRRRGFRATHRSRHAWSCPAPSASAARSTCRTWRLPSRRSTRIRVRSISAMGNRSQVVTPLLREGEPIGILAVQRLRCGRSPSSRSR